MIGLKKKRDRKKKQKVEFLTHVVVTTPRDRSSRCRILRYGLSATAKGYFQACALRHFWAFLLPAALVGGRCSDLLKVPNNNLTPVITIIEVLLTVLTFEVNREIKQRRC